MPQMNPVKAAWSPGKLITKYIKYRNELTNLTPFPRIKYFGGLILNALNPAISFAEGYKASPANITIGVNENVTIKVGNCDLKTGNWSIKKMWFFLADRFLTFKAEFPDGNPSGVWFVNFNPPTVSQKSVKVLVTNATISLTSPPVANTPIQNTLIRINITDTWVAKNLWWPEYEYWNILPKGVTPVTWFLGALSSHGYNRMSGKIILNYYNIDVLVKVKQFHAVKIQAVPPDSLSPSQITTIPVLLENQGNYNDTFNFRIKTETGYPLSVANNGTITLQPGEQGQALVGVAAPANTIDTGTLHSIILEVFSADQPNTTIASQRLFLTTEGLYISGQMSAYTIGGGFFLFLVLCLILIWRRRVHQKISIPPEKPWKIPEEQQHLAELKRTDIKTYEQERIMMEDEYKSALLWYDDYRKIKRKKPKTEKPEKKQKEKPKKPFSTFFKKPQKPPKVEQKKAQPNIPAEDTAKEKALAKIKSEQDKQLKKRKEK
jgi:hypothetical protein